MLVLDYMNVRRCKIRYLIQEIYNPSKAEEEEKESREHMEEHMEEPRPKTRSTKRKSPRGQIEFPKAINRRAVRRLSRSRMDTLEEAAINASPSEEHIVAYVAVSPPTRPPSPLCKCTGVSKCMCNRGSSVGLWVVVFVIFGRIEFGGFFFTTPSCAPGQPRQLPWREAPGCSPPRGRSICFASFAR